uniref:PssE/Cps14G family polysaccharide biosynthesis glycosyltransferase n=1 Tax=Eubacterium cellulosolvens TaxID=29322 RepID=UPI001FA6C146|nr:PssE/Cps14G family polysaccharide biosynthesis glycosyltransferase [[Eubacterium] cellulosolvens]
MTLGTQKFQMNRLVQAVDRLAEQKNESFYIQTGNSNYRPKHCEYMKFLNSEEFQRKITECSVLITHGGVGSIVSGLHAEKPVIVVPRLAKYREHVDDHQRDIAEAFEQKHCVICCEDLEHLEEDIRKAKEEVFEPLIEKGGDVENIILDFMSMFSEP